VLLLLVFISAMALSVMRIPSKDGSGYLVDSAVMADCLRHGQWFGHEDVGEHGILFKLPAAFLFVLFGESAFAGTFITVILAVFSAALCFYLFRLFLKSDLWALAGTWLLITNYQFIHMEGSYLRGIPLLFATLLLFIGIYKNWNKWVIGLLFVLLLDAKESMFFVTVPPFAIWVVLDEWGCEACTIQQKILHIVERWVAGMLPAVVWLCLMFGTSLVPINVWVAQIFGLTVKGAAPEVWHYMPSVATENLWYTEYPAPQIKFDIKNVLAPVLEWINLGIAYCSKLFYPDFFSFFGMPKVIAFPAVIMSFSLFRMWKRNRFYAGIFLVLTCWLFLFIFIVRRGHARYMFPFFPVLILFFVYFIRDGFKRPVFSTFVMLFTAFGVLIALRFDPNIKKVIMSFVVLGVMSAALVMQTRHFRFAPMVKPLIPIVIGCFTILYWVQFAVMNNQGPIYQYLRFGYNSQCRDVLKGFSRDETIWVSNAGWRHLPFMYRRERRMKPKWNYGYKVFLPKKALPQRFSTFHTYNFGWNDLDGFQKDIVKYDIQHLILTESILPEVSFSGADQIENLDGAAWLEKERVQEMKGKRVHVYKVQ